MYYDPQSILQVGTTGLVAITGLIVSAIIKDNQDRKPQAPKTYED